MYIVVKDSSGHPVLEHHDAYGLRFILTFDRKKIVTISPCETVACDVSMLAVLGKAIGRGLLKPGSYTVQSMLLLDPPSIVACSDMKYAADFGVTVTSNLCRVLIVP